MAEDDVGDLVGYYAQGGQRAQDELVAGLKARINDDQYIAVADETDRRANAARAISIGARIPISQDVDFCRGLFGSRI